MSKQEMPGIERSDSFNTHAQKELLCVRRRSLWTGRSGRRRRSWKDEKMCRERLPSTKFRLTMELEIVRRNKGSPSRSSGRACLLLRAINGDRESLLRRYEEHRLHHRREEYPRHHRHAKLHFHRRREGCHRRRPNLGSAHYWNARGPDSCG